MSDTNSNRTCNVDPIVSDHDRTLNVESTQDIDEWIREISFDSSINNMILDSCPPLVTAASSSCAGKEEERKLVSSETHGTMLLSAEQRNSVLERIDDRIHRLEKVKRRLLDYHHQSEMLLPSCVSPDTTSESESSSITMTTAAEEESTDEKTTACTVSAGAVSAAGAEQPDAATSSTTNSSSTVVTTDNNKRSFVNNHKKRPLEEEETTTTMTVGDDGTESNNRKSSYESDASCDVHKVARREQNRLSAKKSRAKKKKKVETMHKLFDNLKDENKRLRDCVVEKLGHAKVERLLQIQREQARIRKVKEDNAKFVMALRNPANRIVDSEMLSYMNQLQANIVSNQTFPTTTKL